MPVKKTIKTKKIPVKKTKIKKEISVKKPLAKKTGLEVSVISAQGKKSRTHELNKELFGVKENNSLVVQALHVHEINLRQGTQSTKTRGTVSGSTRKIYRQKGTGRARHGSIKAPIFVGGGIVFGPHPRNLVATLPQKMRRKALLTTLSQKAAEQKISIMSGLSEVSGKTKELFNLFKSLSYLDKPLLLIVIPKLQACIRGSRNLNRVSVQTVESLSVNDILQHDQILFAEEAMAEFEKRFTKTVSV